MFVAPTPPGSRSGPFDDGSGTAGHAGESASVASRVAAAVWAVALVVGLIALANGYLVVAAATLLLAATAPWFGLAAVLRSKPRVLDSELPWPSTRFEKTAPAPSGGYRIRLPAR